MYVSRCAVYLFYCCLGVKAAMSPSASAQDATATVLPIVPQNMWTETYRAGPYSTVGHIQEVVKNPSQYRRHTFPIRIAATRFDEHYEFFREHKGSVRSLMVLGAKNEHVQKLSTLDSLDSLSLPLCNADDFRPLSKLAKLQDLRIANPNLKQFREEELLRHLTSLQRLTLYNVPDLQAALHLPGLAPAHSLQEAGLRSLVIQTPQWTPRSRIDWPEKLDPLREFSVVGERFRFGYLQGQRATFIIGRYGSDDPAICSMLLGDIVNSSGFFNRRSVIEVDVSCRYVIERWPYAVYDKTDLSALKRFSDLRYLTLEGDFYGFEHLRDLPLEWIYIKEMSPTPSQQAIEALSRHPTLKKVTKIIESATESVLYQRRE